MILGTPDEQQPHEYSTGWTNLYFREGDVGLVFTVGDRRVVDFSVGYWDAIHLPEGCS